MTQLRIERRSLGKWKNHKSKWMNCKNCNLHETRRSVVLCRGTIPSNILLIGEAPGKTEDHLGYPFVGPSGQILQQILEESLPGVPYAITNIISCIPLTEDKKIRKPSKEEVLACRDRLAEVLTVVSPKTIVRIGKVSKTSLPDKLLKSPNGKPYKVLDIVHPAYILRQGHGTINYQVHFDRSVNTLKRKDMS